MFIALLEGYLLGLALVILIGPVLFILVNTTLEKGRGHGFATALGIFISDILIVWLCYQGIGEWFKSALIQRYLALGGGLISLCLGIKYMNAIPLKRAHCLMSHEHDIGSSQVLMIVYSLIRGFSVNFVNPFVFIVWLGIINLAQQRYLEPSIHLSFLMMTLLGILTLDLGKVYYVEQVLPFLAPKRLQQIQQVSGGILILFSLRLFIVSY